MTIPPILEPSSEALKRAACHLRDGGVVICPSDANYGIAVDPFNADAVSACFEIKKRAGVKPLTLFINDPSDWQRFGTARNERLVNKLADLYWPGPLNLVLDKIEGAPNLALTADPTISIACHANPVLRQLLRTFNGAVAMTSANLSGASDGVLVDIDAAVQHLGHSVKLALSGGPVSTTTSTTIVRVSDGLSLLREGDLTFNRIQSDILALK